MNETLMRILALPEGIFLGVIFYGGLWWTVRKGLSSQSPAIWFFGSFCLRTGIVLGGFYLLARTDLVRLWVSFAGFAIARIIVSQLIKREKKPAPLEQVTQHAY